MGLGNVSNANGIGCDTHLFNVLLQSLLYIMELVTHSIQSATCHLLVLAQILGIALCGNIACVDIGNDRFSSLGTYFSGLEPYPTRSGMDDNSL